jgi:hypothetical protein
MAYYERVNGDGLVVERVHASDGSYEDTRLGVAVLEETGGWRAAEPPEADWPPAAPEE